MSDNDFINDPFERYIVQNPKRLIIHLIGNRYIGNRYMLMIIIMH